MTLSASFSRDECIGLLVDFLEVSLHQILWACKLYPSEIFRQTQKFNTLVYKSIHPEVNSYIDNTLNTVRNLLSNDFVEKLVLVIKNDKPVERFVFSFHSYYKTTPSGKVTLNVTEIRQQATAIWLTMSQRLGSETHYDRENCTFAFEIHTRNVAYDKMLERQSTEDFQWIVADNIMNPNSVMPIRKLDSNPFCIDVYTEDYRGDDS
ncbi:MAD2-like protein [Daphnia magna]|uniref:MAD2-like protein n=1 Tax=Daphnia magna TaxID=35525 RepID=A0A164KUH7_9CRUS|nr:MAD2-like protein [Daphnia magna]